MESAGHKTSLDDLKKSAIRKYIHEYHTKKRQLVSIREIYEKLKTDIYFPGGKSTFPKIIKELGFKWNKSQHNKRYDCWVKKSKTVKRRIEVLKGIAEYRAQGRSIVFVMIKCLKPPTLKKCVLRR